MNDAVLYLLVLAACFFTVAFVAWLMHRRRR